MNWPMRRNAVCLIGVALGFQSLCLATEQVSLFKALGLSKKIEFGEVRFVDNSGKAYGGRQIELMELEFRNEQIQANGAMIPSLATSKMASVEDVVICLKTPEKEQLDRSRYASIEEFISASKAQLLIRNPFISIESFCAREGITPTEKHIDNFRCTLTKEQLLKIAFSKDVASIERWVSPEPLASYGALLNSAFKPSMTNRGASSIKCATFEAGLSDAFLQCYNLWPRPVNLEAPGGSQNTHTEICWALMRNTTPYSQHFHKRSWFYEWETDWIKNNSINTLSQSTAGSSDPLDLRSRAMDELAFVTPFPVFCNPTGNQGYQYVPYWGSYNSINVGNVRHKDLNTYMLDGVTQTTNPSARYGWTNDRELPMVVVPGIAPYDNDVLTGACLQPASGGTSLSAPILNGICANLMSSRSELKYSSEKVRAVILVTAQNVDGAEWSYLVDGRDGAGTVSGNAAEIFAAQYQNVLPGGSAVENGMGARIVYAGEYVNYSYNIKIPSSKPAGKHLRVVLTWNSVASRANGTNDLTDFDLVVNVNGQYTGSYSYDSNVEIVDIPSSQLTAGATYQGIVSHIINRIPAGKYTSFCIAWTWAKDSAN